MVTDGHPVDFFVVSGTMLGNVSMFSWFMRTWLWHYIFHCLCDTQCAYRALLCSVVVKKKPCYWHISGCFFYQLVTSYPWGKKIPVSFCSFYLWSAKYSAPQEDWLRVMAKKYTGGHVVAWNAGTCILQPEQRDLIGCTSTFSPRCHFHFCFRMRCHVDHWEGASRTPVSSRACSFIAFSLGRRYWSSNTQLAFDITSLIKNRDCRYLAQDERLAREFAARRLIGVTAES